jgi:quinol monooxygenase YgiN
MSQDALEGFPVEVFRSEAPVTLFVTVPIAEAGRSDVRKALPALVAGSRAEKGCLIYEVHESVDAPGRVLFYERWASGAQLAAHQTSAAMTDFGQMAMPHLAGPLDVRRLTPVEEAGVAE